MKHHSHICILIMFLFLCSCRTDIFSCSSKDDETSQSTDHSVILDYYRNHSRFTNPGKYKYMYNNLPESYKKLCDLIKCQFIHPVDLRSFPSIPISKISESNTLFSAEDLLGNLIKLDSNGIVFDRKPENRLVVACIRHSIFLASILKSRQIPARVRYGYAPYLSPHKDKYVSHVICEVWNEKDKRWMFIDPDRKMVDFPRNEFFLAGDLWLQYRNSSFNFHDIIGINLVTMLCWDINATFANELTISEVPTIGRTVNYDYSNLKNKELKVFDKISLLFKNIDVNYDELKEIYDKYNFLHYKP